MVLKRFTHDQAFVTRLEESVERGDLDHVQRNLDQLERVLAELMDYQHRLAKLQYRARQVRDRCHGGDQ